MMSWTKHVASTGDMRNGYATEFYLGIQKGRNCLGVRGEDRRYGLYSSGSG
jgi:hypothetical protein